MRTDHRTRRRGGVLLMLSSLLVAATGLLGGPALAAAEERETAELTKEATWYAPRGEILPATLVSEFPPGVVCIVRPELCRDELDGASGAVEGAIGTAITAEEDSQPAQPAGGLTNPETLPVSVTGGKPDHRSAFQIELPALPDGEQLDRFTLHLAVSDPTYSNDSPAFRQAVLAALTCAREDTANNDGPGDRCQQDQFTRISETQPRDADRLGVEVCPIAADTPWEGERGQPASTLPDAECLYGANGVYSEDGEEVAFDLTFAMQAILGGELPYHGFLVRPKTPPNLAHGDADTSFNKMVSLAKAPISYTMTTSDAPEPVDIDFGGGATDPSTGGSDGGTAGSDTSTGTSDGASSFPSSTGGSGDLFAAPSTADPEAAAAPDVADPAPAGGDETPLVADPVASEPLEGAAGAWYVWLLVPVFGAGMYLTAQSLTAAPVVAESAGRSGAMTRLLEKRAAGAAAPPELVRS